MMSHSETSVWCPHLDGVMEHMCIVPARARGPQVGEEVAGVHAIQAVKK